MKFYICEHCKNIAIKVIDKKVPMFCCGQIMQEAKINTNDGAHEKHRPVAKVENNTVVVEVGSVAHPMTSEHLIEKIVVETNLGSHIFDLNENMQPKIVYNLCENEQFVNAYSICNLHGIYSCN